MKLKKLYTFFILCISVVTSGIAQNANRSGVFVEAGAGLFVGTVPYSKIEWNNNNLSGHRPSGPDINLAIGYRGATSSVFAWEFKIESSLDPSSVKQTLVLGILPGIRITTKEIFSNTSLYFGLNAGYALGSKQIFYYNRSIHSIIYKHSWGDGEGIAGGAKISVCAGLNITHAFYVGLYWDYNFLSSQIGNVNHYEIDDYGHNVYGSNNRWGSVGVRLGYRF